MRVLNAVHGPEDLFDSVENDAVARLLAGMICGEAAMVGRMPVLCRDDKFKVSLQFVGDGDDFITMWRGQRATGQEVILKVNDDQRLHFAFFLVSSPAGLGQLSTYLMIFRGRPGKRADYPTW